MSKVSNSLYKACRRGYRHERKKVTFIRIYVPIWSDTRATDCSPDLRGGFMGLSLSNTREDLVRSTMEGIALALKETLDILQSTVTLENKMLLCGGGSKSRVWRQIFADVYGMDIIKTNIDQNAAALGAAALAANACGLWDGYERIDQLHQIESIEKPVPVNVSCYHSMQKLFHRWTECLAELGNNSNL